MTVVSSHISGAGNFRWRLDFWKLHEPFVLPDGRSSLVRRLEGTLTEPKEGLVIHAAAYKDDPISAG